MPHLSHFPHHHSHLGHSQHGHHHQLNTGRWNPFSETRLQQLLSPFDAGSGWAASPPVSASSGAGWRGGSFKDDADLEGMLRKMQMSGTSAHANAGAAGQDGKAGAGTRFEKRALSQGAVGYGSGQGQGQGYGQYQGRSGLRMTAAQTEAPYTEQGREQGMIDQDVHAAANKGSERGEGSVSEDGTGKAMARRQSMPEGMFHLHPLITAIVARNATASPAYAETFLRRGITVVYALNCPDSVHGLRAQSSVTVQLNMQDTTPKSPCVAHHSHSSPTSP